MYNRRPWDQRPDYSYLGPFSSNEERLLTQALAVADVPGSELSQVVRPPLPQVQLFPPRTGYDRTALGIDDIVIVDRRYPTRIAWFSGGTAGYSGSSRNSLEGL